MARWIRDLGPCYAAAQRPVSGRSAAVARLLCCATAGLALAALGGCASSLPEASVGQANQQFTAGYSLGPGDRLRITVFDEPTLTGEYLVGTAGSVALPLIDEVPARNETPQALAAAIKARLEKGGYVQSPRVAVEVLNYRPFYILGEVNKPGEYPYSGELTLEQAIAKAGGFTARANKRAVALQRQGWGAARTIKVGAEPLLVAPGDTLVISEAFF